MGFADYISESEAANVAGVSIATLNRFAETGYLEIETDSDGLRMFSVQELSEVFGIEGTKLRQEKIVTKRPVEEKTPDPTPTTFRNLDDAASAFHSPLQEKVTAKPRVTTGGEIPVQEKQTTQPRIPKNVGVIRDLEQRITVLQNVVDMQEKVLDLREEELQSIKSERDWLKTRIERLEEKSDRDQLLLLSETQLLRQVILHRERKASPVRAALEWLGIAKEKPLIGDGGPSSAIEVKDATK